MLPHEEQALRAEERRQAILRSGHKFITLLLRSRAFSGVSGVHVCNAIPFFDESNGGKLEYTIEVIGGAAEFRRDIMRGGEEVCHLLDNEHNRRFLASHYGTQPTPWVIEDKAVEAEIVKLHKEMAKRVAAVMSDERPTVKAAQNEYHTPLEHLDAMSPEEIEKLAAAVAARQVTIAEQSKIHLRQSTQSESEPTKKNGKRGRKANKNNAPTGDDQPGDAPAGSQGSNDKQAAEGAPVSEFAEVSD